jgi:hypothetical protein
MDIERRRIEAADYKRKPRLCEDDEVPPHIHRQSELAEKMAEG